MRLYAPVLRAVLPPPAHAWCPGVAAGWTLPSLLFFLAVSRQGGGSTQALLMSGSLLDWGGRPPTWLSRTHDEFSPVILNVVD